MAFQRLGYMSFLYHAWISFMHWLFHRDFSCPLLLKRLMGQSIVYGIWAERDRKVHEGKTSISSVIFK
ncbi:unnamed protein product [Brassica rapa subsp. trilocularis]